MDYYVVRRDDELQHYGIRGQRWGVRRYQNSDGSLTAAGRKRYNQEMEKLEAREKVLKNKQRTANKIAKLDAKKKELDEKQREIKEMEGRHKRQAREEFAAKFDKVKDAAEKVKDTATKAKNAVDEHKVKKAAKDAIKDAKKAEKEVAKAEKDAVKEAKKKAKTNTHDMIEKKKLEDMTDAELSATIDRLRLEKTYKQLQSELHETTMGEKLAKQFGDKVVSAALDGGGKFIKNAMDKAIDKYNKENTPPSEYDKLKKDYDLKKLKKDIADLDKPKNDDMTKGIQNLANFYGNLNKLRKTFIDMGLPTDEVERLMREGKIKIDDDEDDKDDKDDKDD